MNKKKDYILIDVNRCTGFVNETRFTFALNPLSKEIPKIKNRIVPQAISLTLEKENIPLKGLGDIRLKLVPKMLTGRSRMRHKYKYAMVCG